LKKLLFILLFFVFFNSKAQHRLSGYVVDSTTQETLIGCSIRNLSTKNGVVSNTYGYFTIERASLNDEIEFSFVGYKTQKRTIKENTINIKLAAFSHQLDEVQVKSNDEASFLGNEVGKISLSMARIKKIPALFGEVDALKALAFLPGVVQAQEGTTGLVVRGGSPDQNLILLDESPVYNPSHLYGLLSTFNPDIIKNLDFYKSGFPARFGGRISSILDIQTRNGSLTKKRKEYTLGILSSRFLAEGPIGKNTSYLVAGRTSFLDLFTWPLYLRYRNVFGNYINYRMIDLNVKLATNLRNNGKLYFSVFASNDDYRVFERNDSTSKANSTLKLKWFNTTVSTRYIKEIGQKTFSKTTLYLSDYRNITDTYLTFGKEYTDTIRSNTRTSIVDVGLKTQIEHYLNEKYDFKVGLEAIFHKYQPTLTKASFEFNPDKNKIYYGKELSGFIENTIKPTKKFTANLGIRATIYAIDNELYNGIEPRISLAFTPTKSLNLFASLERQNQFAHQLINNSFGLPTGFWVPISKKAPQQYADQLSVGVATKINSQFELMIEAYTKTLKNQIDLSIGKNLLTSYEETWEQMYESNGIGRAKGIEIFLNKKKGALTGTASYTLSRSERKFERINNGNWFDFYFDRRQMFSLSASYVASKKYSFSGSWSYLTGSPISVPLASIIPPNPSGYLIYIHGDRNNFRLPNYHRLDFSVSKTKITKKGNENMLSFGLYNVYNQVNALYVIPKSRWVTRPEEGVLTNWTTGLYKQGFLPILPFVSFTKKIL
jgi:CarboxypepD_reg-like domain/TonB-dependent Receptor Plug Domain